MWELKSSSLSLSECVDGRGRTKHCKSLRCPAQSSNTFRAVLGHRALQRGGKRRGEVEGSKRKGREEEWRGGEQHRVKKIAVKRGNDGDKTY